ncbi:hypothetical protein OS493_010633 [Desmophyllum pertusum]|uniref:LamG-like jellyroll fold domain-containing protein n=1 Tax=Desmophyllum pertusum TaxID=174260 RepID=A0A9W9ZQW1_9CNID|nr:hypothetical protein OS493_010633 [Desmophyllum pertusum]
MRICVIVAVSVPDPIALYPLNSKYEAREINNKQPEGTLGNVSLAAGPDGKPGGSFQFFGQVNSYIDFPNDGGLDVNHSITMLCWVYPESSAISGPLFYYTDYNPSVVGGVQLWIDSGKLVARFEESYQEPLTTTDPLALNNWHYVGSSYDGNTGMASLWLNGTSVVSQDIGYITLATGYNVAMGEIYDNRFFQGRITAMQVYDVALTAVQINAVKDAGRGDRGTTYS